MLELKINIINQAFYLTKPQQKPNNAENYKIFFIAAIKQNFILLNKFY